MKTLTATCCVTAILLGFTLTSAAQDDPAQPTPPAEPPPAEVQDGEQASDTDVESAPGTDPEAETALAPETFDELDTRFRELLTKINEAGGFAQAESDAIDALLPDVRSFNEARAPTTRSLAIEYQLMQWASTASPDVFDAYFDRFENIDLTHPGLRLVWADYLINRRFRPTQALAVLDAQPLDLASYPSAALLRAQALTTLSRFADASAALDTIPADAKGRERILDNIYRLRRDIDDFTEDWQRESALREAEAATNDLPRVELATTKGTIVVELFENEAPNTVANFISLVESGFYDGLKFHRVIPGSQVQTGNPNERADLVTQPRDPLGYTIADEVEDGLARHHYTGTLSMANALPNTGASEFLITLRARPERNGRYTSFGRIIEGMEVVETLTTDDVIQTATVVRKREHEYLPNKFSQTPPAPTPPADPATGEGEGEQSTPAPEDDNADLPENTGDETGPPTEPVESEPDDGEPDDGEPDGGTLQQ
ncbi:MAG: peptidylprolyl isomerase [Phycisphaerales bacterium]